MRRILAWCAGLLLLVVLGLFTVGAGLLDRALNRVRAHDGAVPSQRAKALYPTLAIADLHADPLLWKRDLLVRNTRGHVDVPRLIEGNVAVQSFFLVTKTPFGLNIESNRSDSDMLTGLVVANGWPRRTWGSLLQRALYEAEKLNEFARTSGGKFRVLRTRAELDTYLADRKRDSRITAGIIGLEGAHALEGNLANLDVLYDAGLRIVAHAHFFDNDMSGSAHGIEQAGLTALGRDLVRKAEEKRMLIDLAHASPRTIDDVLAMVTRPVVVSHTGVRATCNNSRNLSDEHIRGIARTGGVIGIGYWDLATCGTDARAAARAMRHVATLVGIDHVGLGSDYDGVTNMPFDTAHLIELIDPLFEQGFSDEEVRKIMGENELRIFREYLP